MLILRDRFAGCMAGSQRLANCIPSPVVHQRDTGKLQTKLSSGGATSPPPCSWSSTCITALNVKRVGPPCTHTHAWHPISTAASALPSPGFHSIASTQKTTTYVPMAHSGRTVKMMGSRNCNKGVQAKDCEHRFLPVRCLRMHPSSRLSSTPGTTPSKPRTAGPNPANPQHLLHPVSRLVWEVLPKTIHNRLLMGRQGVHHLLQAHRNLPHCGLSLRKLHQQGIGLNRQPLSTRYTL